MERGATRRPAVEAFADLMEARLAEHDARHGGDTWRQAACPSDLVVYAADNVNELADKVNAWRTPGMFDGKPDNMAIMRQAADVANYAMMVADRCGPLPPASEVPADVRRLVIAARNVAFGDEDAGARAELDAASEAFASRVAWDDAPPASGVTVPEGEVGRLAARIAEVVEEDGGCWHACSGCQESSEGYVSERDYPYSPIFKCQPGGGCRECGGIGVLWEDGAFLASYGEALSTPSATPGALDPATVAPSCAPGEVERLRKATRDLTVSLDEMLTPLERASAEMVAHGKPLNEAGEAAFDRARNAIAAGLAALSPQGLDAKEGGPTGALLICDQTGGRMFTAWPVQQHVKQEADSLYGDTGGYRTVPLYATPSQRLDAATVERCAQVADEQDANGKGLGWRLTARCIADAIRALATEPHQHGGKA